MLIRTVAGSTGLHGESVLCFAWQVTSIFPN